MPFFVVLKYFGKKAIGVGGGGLSYQPKFYGCSVVLTAILLLFADGIITCGERRRLPPAYPTSQYSNLTSSALTAFSCDNRVKRIKSPYGQNAESLNVNACGKHSNHRAFKALPRRLA